MAGAQRVADGAEITREEQLDVSAAEVLSQAETPGATTSATVAADRAAVADIGPVTRCRELPSAA